MKPWIFLVLIFLGWAGCAATPTERGVYVFLSPSGSEKKEALIQALDYIINDMSPSDVLVIDPWANQPMKISFASTMQQAYEQKRALKKMVRDVVASMPESLPAPSIQSVLDKAQTLLGSQSLALKSIIMAVPQETLASITKPAKDVRLSWAGFLEVPEPQTVALHHVLTLASVPDLDQALKVR